MIRADAWLDVRPASSWVVASVRGQPILMAYRQGSPHHPPARIRPCPAARLVAEMLSRAVSCMEVFFRQKPLPGLSPSEYTLLTHCFPFHAELERGNCSGQGPIAWRRPNPCWTVWPTILRTRTPGSVLARLVDLIRPQFEDKTIEAFCRVFFDGAAPAAMAQELGVSVNAVLVAKSRVLSRLRQEAEGFLDW